MKNKFWVFALFLGYACSLLFSEIPRKITVGLNESYPPYTFIEGKERPTGIFPEIIDAAAKIAGIEVEYVQFQWARMSQEAEKGKIDAVMGIFKTSEREKCYEFSGEGLIYEEYSFFTLKGCGIKHGGKSDELKSSTIGTVRDYNYGPNFEQAEFFKKREACDSDQNVIEKLIKKRFDIAIGNKMVIEYYAKKLDALDKIEWLSPPVSSGYSHVIAFSKAKGKQSKELTQKFSEAIKQLIKNGTFKIILDKYDLNNTGKYKESNPSDKRI